MTNQISDPTQFAFIGGGQMASALIGGLINAGTLPANILVFDPNADQQKKLDERWHVQTGATPDERLRHAKVVIWAVKPQVLQQAVKGVKPYLGDQLHVSIAAGVQCTTLAAWLGSERLVRAMPNTSALIGAGVTGMTAAPSVSKEDRNLAEQLLSSTGYCFWVADDGRLDAVTAISGSGPAYVFHFLEAFQAAAQSVGFDEAMARELVLRTAVGAVQQAQQGGGSFAILREQVTSRRGTTEAALDALDRAGTPNALSIAVSAAYSRAQELSIELAKPEGDQHEP